MPKRIRTAIIGFGESGRLSHGYGLTANPIFDVCAVCDLSAENRARATAELGCPSYPDTDQLFHHHGLDLVSIVTRSDTHADLACDCLARGAHVLITKPWALDTAEARRIMAAAAKANRLVFPWIPVSWAPDYTLARDIIAMGRLGDVFMIRRYLSDFRYRDDWQTLRRFGGGYLLNWGMHVLQPVLSLANAPLRKLQADLLQVITPGDTEDHFTIHMEFTNGVRGIAEFTKALAPLPALFIQGTHGTLVADDTALTIIEQDPKGGQPPRRESIPLVGKRFGDEAAIYAEVAQALHGERPFRVSPEDALAGTIALDCARTSHETGQPVFLPAS